ncbi:hypothetical protein AVEN_149876-1 [Araneus ventricosus]|uniref:Uncharacterized protein n=1 Tax=Araneus ventricosus TaxID=182803 RepID=A0A4Y2E070_ARAVE|nr:hypothetical protein AVEN_149876-1 [Araneus ventricosus]
MAEMKAGQEEMRVAQAGLEQKMEVGQEEMRSVQEEMRSVQEEMRSVQEEMRSVQEEMRSVQEEMRSGQKRLEKELRSGQEEMKSQIQAHTESQIEEIKIHVDLCIGKIEKEVQCVKLKIEEVESEVQRKIEEVEQKVQGKIGDIERRLNELFKTHFDVVSFTNGWTDFVKANQLVASLQGSAAEVLQGIPSDKLTDITAIEKALEFRFGDRHLTQFYRTELKTKRQKQGESLQVLAADVERLMSLAYAECPLDVRESLAAQYFVDTIRDEEKQLSTRLIPDSTYVCSKFDFYLILSCHGKFDASNLKRNCCKLTMQNLSTLLA